LLPRMTVSSAFYQIVKELPVEFGFVQGLAQYSYELFLLEHNCSTEAELEHKGITTATHIAAMRYFVERFVLLPEA